jgi:predicted nucleotide-binding protein (sugar kinase/HSP70/actin superfamily)
MTAAETIAHGVKVFSQEIADLRHSLHISKAQAAEKDQRIAGLEMALREIARPTYGTEINDTDAERADILGRCLVRFQRIAHEALKPKPSKE